MLVLLVGLHSCKIAPSVSNTDRTFLDYAHSYICTPGNDVNATRFSIEARTSIVDERNGHAQVTDFYVTSPMQRERAFSTPPLFDASTGNNADFIPVYDSTSENIILFRRWAEARPNIEYKDIQTSRTVWGTPIFKLRRQSHLRELKTYTDIAHASAEGFPILARVKIWSRNDSRLYAYLEFPAKTINVKPRSAPDFKERKSGEMRCWQVDTGLVLFPDLDQYDSYKPKISSLALAYIAFNTFDSVDLVVDEAKPNRDKCKVYQFSKEIVGRPAEVTLFAVKYNQFFMPYHMAVVVKDVPADSVVAGVPARIMREADK